MSPGPTASSALPSPSPQPSFHPFNIFPPLTLTAQVAQVTPVAHPLHSNQAGPAPAAPARSTSEVIEVLEAGPAPAAPHTGHKHRKTKKRRRASSSSSSEEEEEDDDGFLLGDLRYAKHSAPAKRAKQMNAATLQRSVDETKIERLSGALGPHALILKDPRLTIAGVARLERRRNIQVGYRSLETTIRRHLHLLAQRTSTRPTVLDSEVDALGDEVRQGLEAFFDPAWLEDHKQKDIVVFHASEGPTEYQASVLILLVLEFLILGFPEVRSRSGLLRYLHEPFVWLVVFNECLPGLLVFLAHSWGYDHMERKSSSFSHLVCPRAGRRALVSIC